MHLITQPVHVLFCSDSAVKGNNGRNRILHHDIAAQTITERLPCFTVRTVLQTLTLPDVENNVEEDSPDHITRTFPVVRCPGFMVVTPSFTHLSIAIGNHNCSSCSPTVDVGFLKHTSDIFVERGSSYLCYSFVIFQNSPYPCTTIFLRQC
jgi:hypothetical protein